MINSKNYADANATSLKKVELQSDTNKLEPFQFTSLTLIDIIFNILYALFIFATLLTLLILARCGTRLIST